MRDCLGGGGAVCGCLIRRRQRVTVHMNLFAWQLLVILEDFWQGKGLRYEWACYGANVRPGSGATRQLAKVTSAAFWDTWSWGMEHGK